MTSVHPVRRLTSWLEGFAEKPHAAVALVSCAFIEASIFPTPPDVLLVALGVTRPRRSILYALLVVCGSSAGALLGYTLGNSVFDVIGNRVITAVGASGQFDALLHDYRTNALPVLVLAGFTSIPFMVFTIAAGFHSTVDPATLFLGALCGRMIRFLPIGVALFYLGPRVKYYLDRYLYRTIIIMSLAVILFLIVLRSLH
jgi:membrane protein YqaA with SNARE-associated domain